MVLACDKFIAKRHPIFHLFRQLSKVSVFFNLSFSYCLRIKAIRHIFSRFPVANKKSYFLANMFEFWETTFLQDMLYYICDIMFAHEVHLGIGFFVCILTRGLRIVTRICVM